MSDVRGYVPTLYLIACIVAIVVGILIYANAWHLGAGHQVGGVIEFTIGVLGLLKAVP